MANGYYYMATDQVNFDKLVGWYAESLLEVPSQEEMNVDEFTEFAWGYFDTTIVDDIEKAKDRFFAAFPKAVEKYRREHSFPVGYTRGKNKLFKE